MAVQGTDPQPSAPVDGDGPGAKVLIIEDHQMVAETIEFALTRHGHDAMVLPLPETGGSMATLRVAALRIHPRIVLLDLDLGRFGDGMELIAPLARGGANVVVLTASTDRGRWGACVREGARKVMSKNQPLRETLSVVRKLHQGLPVMDSEELERLLGVWRRDRMAADHARRRLELLTPREKQVLGALVEGRQVHDIARTDLVSEATVRTQIKSIHSKLEVSSQVEAVGLAHSIGWHAT